MPIERAPLWALALAALSLALVSVPATVGILDAFGVWNGRWGLSLALGAGLAIAVVAVLASRRRWRRDRPQEKPISARIATWVFSSLLYPFLLQGLLAMFLWPKRADFPTSLALGLIVAAAQALGSLLHRIATRRATKHS